MCGIIARWTRAPRAAGDDVLARALAATAHRGPDGSGTHRPSPHVELGHHRLAIISPVDGHQPVLDAETGVAITYNGEVFNFRELRRDLEARGHRFHTHCDTEVVLRGYIEHGPAIVERLNGMFAFVIHDPRDGTLFGARDRMGVKPLYYSHAPDRFICASEIKALLADPGVPPRLGGDALFEYLVFGFVAGADTLFSGVREVEPGCRFVLRDGVLAISRYWDQHEPANPLTSEAEALERLDALLQSSVDYRLIADVPVGILLSGGVDSSLVAHYSRSGHDALTAYSLRDVEEAYDETRYARMVADPRGMPLRVVDIDGREVLDCLETVTWHYDEPLIQTNTIGLYKLCREIARDGIKVLLTGEGGDELFGGYDRHLETLRAIEAGQEDALLYGRNGVAFPRIDAFWPDRPRRFPYREFLAADLGGARPGNRILFQDQKTYLLHLLQRPDRMGMACGIELRVPFLDYRLVEAANAIDPGLKIHPDQKYILKKLASRHLPHELIYRPKQAFDTPVAKTLAKGELNGYFHDTMTNRAHVANLFDMKGIHALMERFERGETSLWRILWQTMCVETWMKLFRVES